MAVKDLTIQGLHNRKRKNVFGVYELQYSDLTGDGSVVANLPEKIIPLGYTLISTGVTADATADVTVGGVTLIEEMPIDVTHNETHSAAGTLTIAEFPLGGQLVIKAGDGAASAGSIKFILNYLEYDRLTGEYTK